MNIDKIEFFIDQLQNQVNSNTQFIKNNNTIFYKCAWQNLFQATQVLMKCIRLIDNKGTDKDNYLNLLLINCLSDIFNSLLSTISGFTRGPSMILRGVIENIAIIIVIQNDQDKFELFVNGKLQNTSQISAAKSYWPNQKIGELYGYFTNSFVHEKFETSARCLINDGCDVVFSLLPKSDQNDYHRHLLYYISIISKFVGALTEYCHVLKITDFCYWNFHNDILEEKMNNYEDNLIKQIITELANNP